MIFNCRSSNECNTRQTILTYSTAIITTIVDCWYNTITINNQYIYFNYKRLSWSGAKNAIFIILRVFIATTNCQNVLIII